MKISVVVPIYNVEKYLHQCVDSILAQMYQDIEIILVDDGSTDTCPKICDDYEKSDERIKVIHKINGGLISARKAGVQVATGDYVGFVDGDDFIAPNMYQCMIEKTKENDADIVACGYWESYPNKKIVSNPPFNGFYCGEVYKKDILSNALAQHGKMPFGLGPNVVSKLFKRDLFLKIIDIIPDQITMGEDVCFTYTYMALCSSIQFLNEPLYYYRINTGSMSHKFNKKLWENNECLYNTLEYNFKKFEVDDIMGLSVKKYYVYMINRTIYKHLMWSNESKKEKISAVKARITNKVIKCINDIKKDVKERKLRLLLWLVKHRCVGFLYWYYARKSKERKGNAKGY